MLNSAIDVNHAGINLRELHPEEGLQNPTEFIKKSSFSAGKKEYP